jgi:hypothetical protein
MPVITLENQAGQSKEFSFQDNLHDFVFRFSMQKVSFASLKEVTIDWGDGSVRPAAPDDWTPLVLDILKQLKPYMQVAGDIEISGGNFGPQQTIDFERAAGVPVTISGNRGSITDGNMVSTGSGTKVSTGSGTRIGSFTGGI